jgi:N-6 DNA Methylase
VDAPERGGLLTMTARSTSRLAIRRPSGSPRQHAAAIADALERTWTQDYSTDQRYLPVAVVAALATMRIADPVDDSIAILELDTDCFTKFLDTVWHLFESTRPELAVHARPLLGWTCDEPSAELRRAAHRLGHTALTAGLFHLTGTEARYDIDLLGLLLQRLRSKSARDGLGQFFTPMDVAQVIAEMTFQDVELAAELGLIDAAPGQSIMEPTAGTGGMLAMAAAVIRGKGHDPAAFQWYANDIDPIAVACLAVNAHSWDLGRQVYLSCANGLDVDWPRRARQTHAALSIYGQARALAEAMTLLMVAE